MACSGFVELLVKGNRILIDRDCYSVNSCDIDSVLSSRHRYDVLNAKGRVVVDIGAGCGDTAILYSLSGALVVYAIEPNPVLYRALLRTLEANGLTGKVIPLLAALSDRCGLAVVDESMYSYAYEEFQAKGSGFVQVELFDYDALLELLYHPQYEYVLKVDCEGCEKHLLGRDLSVFSEVLIECHSGDVCSVLRAQLESQGFKVNAIDIFGSSDVMLLHCVKSKA
ncbi:MAG: FkbM family methyltransferase [Candidatus Nezhaarchaeales archaeon]